MKYRTDIDGLRAIAVLSVVMFHAGLSAWMPGGFVGVDIFFVISGYLICGILMREFASSTFSISRFYERRIRRIIPALYAMILASCCIGAFVLLPSETSEFSLSMLSTILFGSNIFFYFTTDYFDGGVTRPLLHTWSLAVEEQFYIFFPIYLWAMLKFWPARLRVSLVAVLALSFLVCVWTTNANPSAAFYLPHTRAWELLAGALVSTGIVRIPPKRWLKDGLSVVGLSAIFYSFVAFNEAMAFPGYWAAVPVVGSALIIASGQTGPSLGGSVLSWRPLVLVGLCSYSIYLWHWPLIVFVKLLPDLVVSQGRLFGLVILGLSIVMGYLSWRFVETPFRSRQRVSARSVFLLSAGAGAALVLLGITAIAFGGWSSRYSPEAQRMAGFLNYQDAPIFRRGRCFVTGGSSADYDKATCLHQVSSQKNYLLVGDSHGAHLWYGLSRHLPAHVMQATASGCRPLIGGAEGSTSGCARLFQYVYQDYLVNNSVDALLIAGRWQEGDLGGLEQTLRWAKQQSFPVILFGPVPEYDQSLPRLLAFAHERGRADLPQKHSIQARTRVDRKVQALAARHGIPFISLISQICPAGQCKTQVGRSPLQFDYGHFTGEGSDLVGSKVSAQVERALSIARGEGSNRRAQRKSKQLKQSEADIRRPGVGSK